MQARFLVGPTAAGKSAVAHRIALENGFDILSADSMQVYRGLDIGTAKPTRAERREVRYAGLDLVGPKAAFSVARYREEALAALQAAALAGRRVIVTGGSGLYIKSLTDGLAPSTPPDGRMRRRWERLLADGGVAALRQALHERDPGRLAQLPDSRNPRRLIRALERAESGERGDAGRWVNNARMTGLHMPFSRLDLRIAERARRMFDTGLIDEVRALLKGGLLPGTTAGQAIGYAEAAAYLAGTCTLAESVDRTIARTRRLARRQMTWFRHQAAVRWVEVEEGMRIGAIAAAVTETWRRDGPTQIKE